MNERRLLDNPKVRAPEPDDDDPCLKCGQRIRLGPEARPNENPRWCGECNFDMHEFVRLRAQDEILGRPPRERHRPARVKP
jgi:hypothetical protein